MEEILFRLWNSKSNKYIYDVENVFQCLAQQNVFDKIQDSRFGQTPPYDHRSEGFVWEQYISIKDKASTKIFVNDVLTDGDKKFRVYATSGGFAIKAYYWASDINNLTPSDELILIALPDAQTRSYIEQSCWVIGSIHNLKDETNE